jgi:hypothetical protein
MNILEKMFVIGTVTVTTLFCGYQFIKPKITNTKEDLYKIRQKLLKD